MKKEKEVNVAEEEKEVIDDGFFEEIDEEAEKEAKKAKKKGKSKKKKIAIIAGTVLGCVTAGLIGVSVYKSTQKKKAAGLNVIDGSGSTDSEDKEEQKSDIPENLSDETTDSLMNAARML